MNLTSVQEQSALNIAHIRKHTHANIIHQIRCENTYTDTDIPLRRVVIELHRRLHVFAIAIPTAPKAARHLVTAIFEIYSGSKNKQKPQEGLQLCVSHIEGCGHALPL